MSCLLHSPKVQPGTPGFRILPSPDDFDEAESSSKSRDMNTCKDSSLSLSADETEDIEAGGEDMDTYNTSLLEYTTVCPQNVNRFSPPSDCSSDYEVAAHKNDDFSD